MTFKHSNIKTFQHSVRSAASVCLVFVFSILFAPHALADTTQQGYTPLAPIPNLTQGLNIGSSGSVVNTNTLATFFNQLYIYLIGIAAALAVIEIIWGGFEIAAKDSVAKQTNGRHRITQALLGLALILSPVLIFSIINPSIINLSVNIPALTQVTQTNKAASGTPASPNSASPQPSPSSTSNCSAVSYGQYLTIASCTTQNAVSSYTCSSTNTPIQNVLPCSSYNPNTQTCNVPITVFCSGIPKVTYYQLVKKSILSQIWNGIVSNNDYGQPISTDAAEVNEFTTGCTSVGAKVEYNVKPTSITCPQTGTLPSYDASTYSLECWSVPLICKPS